MKKLLFLIIILFVLIGLNAQTIKPASVFSDHMMIQRNKPVHFWGTIDQQLEIKVTFNHQQKSIFPDKNGNWKVSFPSMQAGGPYMVRFETSKSSFELKDILIGDIWICSGQSNMEFMLRECATAGIHISPPICINPELSHLPNSRSKESSGTRASPTHTIFLYTGNFFLF